MVIKWRSNKIGYFAGPEHIVILIGAALIFFCAELVIEQWLFDNDFIVDLLGASTGALAALLVRFAIVNARLYREARDGSERLERRVSEIAHEFQTPLAILKGNLSFLAKTATPAFETSLSTLDRLSRLVYTLLDVAKLDMPSNQLARTAIDIGHLAQEMCDDCALIGEDRHVTISCADADGLFVAADRDKIKEVILNLLSNALKYTQSGGLISVEMRRTEDDRFIEVAVSDTGCGIAPENLSHVFERFYRITNTDTDGVGLGLYLSKQIIEAHGGTILAESELGRGSRFAIRLPAFKDERRQGVSVI